MILLRTLSAFAVAALLLWTASPVGAGLCSTSSTGARCAVVPDAMQKPLPVLPGVVLERGQYNMVFNVEYLGLDPVEDGWIYMEIEDEVYRVDWHSHEVLAHVTSRYYLF